MNNGICINNFNSFTCKCAGNWTGFNCNMFLNNNVKQKQMDTNCLDDDKKCLNGGSCLKYSHESYYSCKCAPNFTGKTCEIEMSTKLNICSTKPCQNDGKCVQISDIDYECNCKNNYVGKKCEIYNHCLNASCGGNGKCLNTNIGYNCTCDLNFTGSKCDTCIKGYTGEKCNELISFCSPNPCQNGICVWDAFGFKCVCSEGNLSFYFDYIFKSVIVLLNKIKLNKGWKGKNCTEKNCLLNPCLNDGICKEEFDKISKKIEYNCKCPKR